WPCFSGTLGPARSSEVYSGEPHLGSCSSIWCSSRRQCAVMGSGAECSGWQKRKGVLAVVSTRSSTPRRYVARYRQPILHQSRSSLACPVRRLGPQERRSIGLNTNDALNHRDHLHKKTVVHTTIERELMSSAATEPPPLVCPGIVVSTKVMVAAANLV